MKKSKPVLIAGPCVIENRKILFSTATFIKKLSQETGSVIFFKAVFDKANRSSSESYRGVGLEKGIRLLSEIKSEFGLGILTDVHETGQIERIAEVADIIQIPAFLSRQTDLITEAARSGKMVNIKKGQFMSPKEALLAYEKARKHTKKRLFITERGTTFGYSDLVVDFRTADSLLPAGIDVIMDLTPSCQKPAIGHNSSGGDKKYATAFSKIAGALGFSGLFAEVHPNPDKALSDSSTQLSFEEYKKALKLYLKF
ncbi:MAG: 3-deoxy-8-phosphooctulonate synthase, partial [Deltaproteobacteria bacterium]|nr:3-deoxy-8-phosphooctulonate synthase [Deltaproteobacteria bacterium]